MVAVFHVSDRRTNGNAGSTGSWTVAGQGFVGALSAFGDVVNAGGVTADNQSASTQTISANGTTLTVSGTSVIRVTSSAVRTGLILPAGTYAGQRLTVIHEGAAANTLTCAASGTSHVADRVSDVIAGLTSRSFVWDSGTSLWYRAA
jgi:hypothetical protein